MPQYSVVDASRHDRTTVGFDPESNAFALIVPYGAVLSSQKPRWPRSGHSHARSSGRRNSAGEKNGERTSPVTLHPTIHGETWKRIREIGRSFPGSNSVKVDGDSRLADLTILVFSVSVSADRGRRWGISGRDRFHVTPLRRRTADYLESRTPVY